MHLQPCRRMRSLASTMSTMLLYKKSPFFLIGFVFVFEVTEKLLHKSVCHALFLIRHYSCLGVALLLI